MDTELAAKLIEWMEAEMPHGSGIDCTWHYETRKNGDIVARNSFHCMNQNGYYDGYADFSLTIPVAHPIDFALHFHGKTDGYLATKHALREYLDDTFAESMRELQKAFDITVPCKRCGGNGHFAVEAYVNPEYLAKNNLKPGDDVKCWCCDGTGKTA